MLQRIWTSHLSIFLLLLVLAACTAVPETAVPDTAYVTAEALAAADAVVLAQVSAIQADADGQAHYVALTIEDVLQDGIDVGAGVVLTVPGEWPLVQGQTAVPLQAGDTVVALIQRSTLTRDGHRQAVLVPASTNGFVDAAAWAQIAAVPAAIAN